MFSDRDLQQIESRGSSLPLVEKQIQNFKKGFPYLKLSKPATVDDGILSMDEDQEQSYTEIYHQAIKKLSVVKFVPASGAASRMFKDLYEFVEKYSDDDQGYEEFVNHEKYKSVYTFFKNITDFAFFNSLKEAYEKKGLTIEEGLLKRKYKDILRTLLDEDGLNYGNLPKGLLEFHAYFDHTRTSVEEHLVEGALYGKHDSDQVSIHFTVSPEHQQNFEEKIKDVLSIYEKTFHVNFSIDYSIQKPSTDTIAVNMKNEPFRDEDGQLLFRPGGHGALIENLNDIDADLIFVKNIDNVVPDALKGTTVSFKKILGGKLLEIQEKVFKYMKQLENPKKEEIETDEIIDFLKNTLNIQDIPEFHLDDEKVTFLKSKLNRPIRICGMVKNEGEPGGGPFFAKNSDGTISLQIAESSQIDSEDRNQKDILKSSTHFNPVDLVLGVKDYKGKKYDLTKYVDPDTGFISKKSKSGKELKAQELPGLWNGAMSDWNTLFVEVPVITFNPVKTVNDLLRETHQNLVIK